MSLRGIDILGAMVTRKIAPASPPPPLPRASTQMVAPSAPRASTQAAALPPPPPARSTQAAALPPPPPPAMLSPSIVKAVENVIPPPPSRSTQGGAVKPSSPGAISPALIKAVESAIPSRSTQGGAVRPSTPQGAIASTLADAVKAAGATGAPSALSKALAQAAKAAAADKPISPKVNAAAVTAAAKRAIAAGGKLSGIKKGAKAGGKLVSYGNAAIEKMKTAVKGLDAIGFFRVQAPQSTSGAPRQQPPAGGGGGTVVDSGGSTGSGSTGGSPGTSNYYNVQPLVDALTLNAVAQTGEILAQVQTLVNQLTATGGHDDLVTQGQNVASDCQNVINQYAAVAGGSTDTSFLHFVQDQIVPEAAQFTTAANAVITSGASINASSSNVWQPNTKYTVGQQVSNAGNLYQCIASGTSAATGPGPTATDTSTIIDGTVSWVYVAAATGAAAAGATGAQWAPNTKYAAGQQVINGGNIYLCAVGGTSAASGGPTGTGTSIPDGSVIWSYASGGGAAAPGAAPTYRAPWMPSTYYAVGSTVTNFGNLYYAVVAGTSSPQTGPSATSGYIVDGTVQWQYQGPDPNAAGAYSPYGQGAGGGGGGGYDSGGGGGDGGGGYDDSGFGDQGGDAGGDQGGDAGYADQGYDQGDGGYPVPDPNNPGYLTDGSPDPDYGPVPDPDNPGYLTDGSPDPNYTGGDATDTLNQEMDQAEGVSVVGAGARSWDNHDTYEAGEVVYYSQRYWRALRKVTPPVIPALMDGDVPGDSDAWREISEAQADTVLGHGGGHHGGHGGGRGWGGGGPRWVGPWDYGDDVDVEEIFLLDPTLLQAQGQQIIGMFDMNVEQQRLNTLQPVTVGIARSLLKGGLAAINGAIAGAKQPWYKSDLPGETERKNVLAHLQWHDDFLKKFPDTNAGYPSADDLKKYVTMAMVDANAVEAGAQWLQDAWTAMWKEIGDQLAAIPKEVRDAALKVAGNLVESTTGLPLWAWALIGTGFVGLLGFVSYKVATGPVGGAVAGAVTSHYLGRHR